MRYRPPATSYWRHSIYTYNKNATKYLPATTINANKLIRSYLNTVPSKASTSLDRASPSKEAGAAEITPAEKPTATASAASSSRIHDFEEKNRLIFQEHKTSGSRLYVSDRGYRGKDIIRQDILGKISPRMQLKSAFHYPYKDIQAAAPQITYKHYRDGVGISVHVHEGVEEEAFAKQRKSGADKRKQKSKR